MRLVVDARTSAFATLIDDAGVLPPTPLGVREAVEAYRQVRASRRSWVAGRFVIPASRLEELAAVAMATMRAGEPPWEISVVFDLEPSESAYLAAAFHAEMEPAMSIAAAEARIIDPTIDGIERLVTTVGSINPDIVGFFEPTRSANTAAQIRSIAQTIKQAGRVGGATLRCGGPTEDLFPTADEVATFIGTAVDVDLPFKAAGGLDQPIRHLDAELSVHRHGVLNLLMATAAAAQGTSMGTITEIVADTDPAAFILSAAFAKWRDLAIPGSALRRVRQNRFISYSSGDLTHAISLLGDLQLLGEGQ